MTRTRWGHRHAPSRSAAPIPEQQRLFEEGDSVLDAIEPARQRRPGLLRSGAIAGAAVLGTNVLNVAFQLSTARLLPPPEYSLLVTLFSVLLITNVPILSMQARVARDVARRAEAGDLDAVGAQLVDSLRPLARWGAGVIIALALLSVPLSIAFQVNRELPFLALAVSIVATLPLPISWGGLQGLERFPTLAGVQLLYAVLKLAVGIGLAAAGFGAAAIVFGIALVTVVSFAVSLLPLRGLLKAGVRHARGTLKLLDGYTARAALMLALIAALTNIDLIASRIFLSNDEAGLYAAAGVATRALLLLPTIATTVLFPGLRRCVSAAPSAIISSGDWSPSCSSASSRSCSSSRFPARCYGSVSGPTTKVPRPSWGSWGSR